MKIYAFAAFLALSVVGLAGQAAKADYLCCEEDKYHEEFVTRAYHVIQSATVFGCDGYHCETNVVLKQGLNVKARCRNGWCEIRSLPLKNVWVLEGCLEKIGYGPRHGKKRRYEPEHDYESDEDEDYRD
jgi:hypothetical protein